MTDTKKNRFLAKPGWRVAGFQFGYWFCSLLFWEILLHIIVLGDFGGNFGYLIGFTASIAALLALVQSFLPKKVNYAVTLVLSIVLTVLYGSQLVYNYVFGTLYSVALMGQGGQAITSFWKETALTMWEELPSIAMLLIPVGTLLCLRKRVGKCFASVGMVCRVAMVVLLLAAHLSCLLGLRLGETGAFSDYYYYYSDAVATQQNAQRFGLLTTMRLETIGSWGSVEEEEESYYVPIVVETEPAVEESIPGETQPAEPEYNVMELDFDALSTMTEDGAILAINNYCAQLTGTQKNDYTGMLKDYNLILLCGESFSTAAIHPEVTPTLYKLASEGIIFNNYYNSFPNTTTNGEYALCMGLWPDTSRTQAASSLYASRESYLPFTLGNAFGEQLGIQAYGYHNYNGRYYGRQESHPNMGYQMKFADDGMEFTTTWPASDLEMMEQSVDDFIGQEQFHAYYMTFSGHYKYDTSINTMASRNYKQVVDLDYTAPCRAYLSCNIELDKAMAYLMQRLEEEGVADRTAIVLAGDHFPYGLTDKQYEELVGHEIDSFTKFHDTLIFWVGGLEENIVVDEYCCNVDILPTILNLWGLEYDSRLLAGTDVFSDGVHMAVNVNKSFMTDKVWFNTSNGETRYLVDESEIPQGYVDNMIRLVNTKFSISSDILNTGYYNFAFGKEAVKVTKDTWNGS